MVLYHPNVHPTEGDVIEADGRTITILERADRPQHIDTFRVLEDGKETTMHIDEISWLLARPGKVTYTSPKRQ